MVSETWDIMMNRLDEMLEVPEVRLRGGSRVRMHAIKVMPIYMRS